MLKKILVVEDNEDNRRILVYRLRKIGKFDIREAANGQQAIDAVRADLPDLIFMDLKMPVMDGWEATKRIREMDGGDSVRIIALTAQAMAGDEQKALAIGCDAVSRTLPRALRSGAQPAQQSTSGRWALRLPGTRAERASTLGSPAHGNGLGTGSMRP